MNCNLLIVELSVEVDNYVGTSKFWNWNLDLENTNVPITNLEYTHIKYHLLYKPIKTRENSYLDINIQNFGTELFGSLEPKN